MCLIMLSSPHLLLQGLLRKDTLEMVWFGLIGFNASATGSYQGGEIIMKSVFWLRKPAYPEETTDLQQATDETFHTHWRCLASLKQDWKNPRKTGPL